MGAVAVFLPSPPKNDLESVQKVAVLEWIAHNPNHIDVAEAQRWLEAAAARIDYLNKEQQLVRQDSCLREGIIIDLLLQGDTWAQWKVDKYKNERIREFESVRRKDLGLD